MIKENIFEFNVSGVKGKKVMLATPMYGGMGNALYFSSVLQLQDQLLKRGAEFSHSFMMNESLIDRGRNGLVDTFLNTSDAEYLLFIDADVQFRAEDVMVMLTFEKDVVCGPYPKKQINWPVIVEAVKRGEEDPEVLSRLVGEYVFTPLEPDTPMDMLIKVAEAGTGMMLIHRSVFEKLEKAFPENAYFSDSSRDIGKDKKMHAYFRTGVFNGRYLSEDYYFCHKWREIGGDVWLFPWAQTTHFGTYGFQGSVGHLVDLMAKMNADPQNG
jgi:hypothetical protein